MARKWLQLVDEDRNALTSATSVIVDIEDVDTFRDAVKDKYSDSHLTGIAASDLTVFDAKGGVLPNASSSLNDLGRDEGNAIVVQVPQRTPIAMDVRRNLKRIPVEFTTAELKYLLNTNPAGYSLLQSPALACAEALQIRTRTRSAVRRNPVAIRKESILDGQLTSSQAQAKCYACTVLCVFQIQWSLGCERVWWDRQAGGSESR